MNDSGSLALSLGENDVDHFTGGRDDLDCFEVVAHDC